MASTTVSKTVSLGSNPSTSAKNLPFLATFFCHFSGIFWLTDLYNMLLLYYRNVEKRIKHYENNFDNLTKLGAFQKNLPGLYVFDQYEDNREMVANILQGRTIDMVIDDGAHTPESIKKTYESLSPYLSDRFIYLVEDHKDTKKFLKIKEGHTFLNSKDEQLTLVTNK